MYKAGIILATLANIAIWFAVINLPKNILKVIFCDVGQGDGAIVMLGMTQIVIDGGPNDNILGCLGEYMPFFDRHIEMVIMTHPQADHAVGLLGVFNSYDVGVFATGPEANETQGYQEILKVVQSSKSNILNLYAGDRIVSGVLQLNTIWPTRQFVVDHLADTLNPGLNVLGLTTDGTDLNSFGIVTELNYYDTEILFTADTDIQITSEILSTGLLQDIDILKVPHHGSKTGMRNDWLDLVNPELAIISVGKKNNYGHPAKEAIKQLSDLEIKTLRTDLEGDIVVESDGERWWVTK